jgi:cytochrome o ubiquinol oxidase operon protein cyoD
MSNRTQHIPVESKAAHDRAVATYVVGFGLSLALTLAAYFIAIGQKLDRNLLVGLVSVLAFSQFTVQMICFLHLGSERTPRWKFLAFLFMAGVVFIVVAGSIWIMTHLNYHMLHGQQLDNYLRENEGL